MKKKEEMTEAEKKEWSKKMSKLWTPERRAAQAERMRQRMLAKQGATKRPGSKVERVNRALKRAAKAPLGKYATAILSMAAWEFLVSLSEVLGEPRERVAGSILDEALHRAARQVRGEGKCAS